MLRSRGPLELKFYECLHPDIHIPVRGCLVVRGAFDVVRPLRHPDSCGAHPIDRAPSGTQCSGLFLEYPGTRFQTYVQVNALLALKPLGTRVGLAHTKNKIGNPS